MFFLAAQVFFENLLINNPEFKKGLDDYFDFFLENKSGKGYNQFNKVTLPQGAKDAMFWLSPDSGVFGVGRADMFAKIPAYSKIFRKYQILTLISNRCFVIINS